MSRTHTCKTTLLWLRSTSFWAILVIVCLEGCGDLSDRPELYPNKWTAARPDREWRAPSNNGSKITFRHSEIAVEPLKSVAIQTGHKYNLPTLIDIALISNPETQRTWSVARSAAASLGAAQAPYYPEVGFASDLGYQRTMIELPSAAGVLKQWQADPILTLNWTLLDFGRRESASESALERLIAANLAFNRTIQEVVFNTEWLFMR